MSLIIAAIYFFILSLALAILEVQIEGPSGWAEKLPAWRPHPEHWSGKAYAKVMNGKPLTGYHLSVFGFLLIILHMPFFVGFSWNWVGELRTISLFFLISATWDFLWFIVNPHFGIKKFKAIHIWWHQKWLGPWPIDYYYGIALSIIFYTLSSINYQTNFFGWLIIFAVFVAGSILTVLARWILGSRKNIEQF